MKRSIKPRRMRGAGRALHLMSEVLDQREARIQRIVQDLQALIARQRARKAGAA